jgi:propanediol utilization protein
MILAEHLVKEVSIIEVILLINRRRIVFDNLFVVILQQLMPTLHDT